jgi:hypothetical protein
MSTYRTSPPLPGGDESLTPQEDRCRHQKMLKDVPETTRPPLYLGNERWLKHRMKRKWGDHFDTT